MINTPSISIKQVRAINAVALHASLAGAAEHLNISPSSLSRAIGEAEAALGQRLFQRGWTGMEPTSAGDMVFVHCVRMGSNMRLAQTILGLDSAGVPDLSLYLSWHLLDVVQAVRTTGSASGAAELLSVSQPQVSRALTKLAAVIGRPLFRRTRLGMASTADAQVLADLQLKLLTDVMILPELLRGLSEHETGRVALGLLPFSEQDIAVKAFGAMLERHRHVRLQAVTGSYAALTDGLRGGELDFVLGPLRSPSPFETLQERQLHEETFSIVVRAGHPLGLTTPTLADLLDQVWIVAPHGTPTRRYFDALLAREGLYPPLQICEIVTFPLAEQMVLSSNAVGLLTYSDRQRARLRPQLKILPFSMPANASKVGLTFRKHHPLSPAQQDFVLLLIRELQDVRR